MAINYIKDLQIQLQETTPSTAPSVLREAINTPPPFESVFLKEEIQQPQIQGAVPLILRETLDTPLPFESLLLNENDSAVQHYFQKEQSAYKQLFLFDEDQDE